MLFLNLQLKQKKEVLEAPPLSYHSKYYQNKTHIKRDNETTLIQDFKNQLQSYSRGKLLQGKKSSFALEKFLVERRKPDSQYNQSQESLENLLIKSVGLQKKDFQLLMKISQTDLSQIERPDTRETLQTYTDSKSINQSIYTNPILHQDENVKRQEKQQLSLKNFSNQLQSQDKSILNNRSSTQIIRNTSENFTKNMFPKKFQSMHKLFNFEKQSSNPYVLQQNYQQDEQNRIFEIIQSKSFKPNQILQSKQHIKKEVYKPQYTPILLKDIGKQVEMRNRYSASSSKKSKQKNTFHYISNQDHHSLSTNKISLF